MRQTLASEDFDWRKSHDGRLRADIQRYRLFPRL
ncbi:MAG: hypothetical protein R3D56_03930 [Paracoccaceae bacterium]